MRLDSGEHASLQSGYLGRETLDNRTARDSVFSNAEMIVSADPAIPIPEDVMLVGGDLYQLSSTGFVPVASDAVIQMDGGYYVLDDGVLVEIDAPPAGSTIVESRPLGQ